MPTIKDHPIIVVSGLIIAAFVAGISAFIWFDGEINKRINNMLKTPIEQSVPIGTIVAFYSKNGEIPEGWAICNGDNGTPDLRDKFIKGAGRLTDNEITGGNKIKQVRIKIPRMEFATGANYSLALHTRDHKIAIDTFETKRDCKDCVIPFTKAGAAISDPLDVEPPYMKLVYIMKI